MADRLIEEYRSMGAVERLNYYRNLHYADGNQTETGLIAEALNDILPNMFVPPVKVGQTVYVVSRYYGATWRIHECRVNELTIYEKHIFMSLVDREYNFGMEISEIGKTVFITREEAEKALGKGNKK